MSDGIIYDAEIVEEGNGTYTVPPTPTTNVDAGANTCAVAVVEVRPGRLDDFALAVARRLSAMHPVHPFSLLFTTLQSSVEVVAHHYLGRVSIPGIPRTPDIRRSDIRRKRKPSRSSRRGN